MIGSHVAIFAVLTAATLAGYITYLVHPPSTQVADNQRPHLGKLTLSAPDITALKSADTQSVENEKAAVAYLEAAHAILRRAPTAQASASAYASGVYRGFGWIILAASAFSGFSL
jgi:hypothetical protein